MRWHWHRCIPLVVLLTALSVGVWGYTLASWLAPTTDPTPTYWEHPGHRVDEPAPVVMEMVATAYTHAAPGGDINGTGDGITSSGIPVREGIVAVDDSVIPLGTRLYVDGYGEAIAADRGGAIRGNRIDLFYDCPEMARGYGVQTVEVRVLD